MEDVFGAAWREHPASHDAQVDAALASLIDVRGLTLIDDSTLLRQLLLQACPGEQRSVDALLSALTADIPKQLAAAREDATLPALLQGFVRRLQDHAGLDAVWSTWAVRAWAHAFALPTAGLAASDHVVAPVLRSPAPVMRATRIDVGAGTIGGLWDREPAPIDPPAVRTTIPKGGNGSLVPVTRSEPVFSPPVPTAAHFADEESGLEPSLSSVTPEDFADDADPIWAGHARPSDERRRSMFGPLAMVVVVLVVAAIAWFALEAAPWATTSPSAPVAAQTLPPVAVAPTVAPTPAPVTAAEPPSTPVATTPDADVPAPTAVPATPAAVAPAVSEPAPAAVEPPPAAVVPVRRPVITRVDVPSLREGAPFAVSLQVGNVRDLAMIERRVVTSSGAWPRLPTRLQVTGLQRAGASGLAIPFRAMDAPSRAIVEFVAIDKDGTRSEPKRVAIALDQPDPAIAALGLPVACTSATCGVVIESREIEPDVDGRGAIYQLTVRMDDREMVTSTAPYRLQVGSRARVAGTRLVPVVGSVP